MFLLVFTLVTIAIALFYYVATKHFKFWENAGVKCLTPPTLLGVVKQTFSDDDSNFYLEAPEEPYVGMIRLTSLSLSIRDPDLIKNILSKDFVYFHDRGVPFSEKRDPLSVHLFNLSGRKWKILRAKLSPTFTSGKLRGMYPHIKHSADEMVNIVASHADKPESVDLNDIFSRYTTDVILSCAFGLQGNSLKDLNDIYLKMVKLSFQRIGLWRLFLNRIHPVFESILPSNKDRKTVDSFFINTFSSTVKMREESGQKRNDFLDLLMEIKKHGRLLDGHTDDEDASDMSLEFTNNLMAAQAFIFFIAGSETSSATSSFSIIELANNIPIQHKLQKEIDEVTKRHGGLTYEAIMDMNYLDQVISETLRKYPPINTLFRRVTKAYPLPDGRATVPVGTRVYIHVAHLHRDPKYYPDPEKFDPERFSPEAKRSLHKFVYLPFGEGPRICIGARFGLMQVKLGLASLLSQFEVRPKPGVPYPPVLSSKSAVAALEHGANVFVIKRKQQ